VNKLSGKSVQDREAKKFTKYWSPDEQIINKEMVKASGRETIIFDPVRDGPYEEWQGFHPSKIIDDDFIKAVRVIKPGLTRADVKPVGTIELERLEEECNTMKSKGDTCVTPMYLRDLAVKYKFTSGNCNVFKFAEL
jgi:hypothetical protein